jgi:hypothetical protein
MPFIFKRLALFLSIAAAFAADKDAGAFRPPAATAYIHHQTNEKVTIGAEPYAYGDKVKLAFGKLVPYNYGVLPVLVTIQNDSDQTLRLDRIQAEYVGPRHDRVPATPARDVRYAGPVRRPNLVDGGPRGAVVGRSKKNPLDAWEIEGRALAVELLPPGQSASGFLYFRTDIDKGATIYLSGLSEARSGRELFYFEMPLE